MSLIEVTISPFLALNPGDRDTNRLMSAFRLNLLTALSKYAELKVYAADFKAYRSKAYKGYIVNVSYAKVHNKLEMMVAVCTQEETIATFVFQKPIKKLARLEQQTIRAMLSVVSKKAKNQFQYNNTEDLSQNAYRHYLLARFFAKKYNPVDINLAIAHYHKVLDEHPDYDKALSGLASATFQQLRYGALKRQDAPPIRAWLERAIELEPENVEAYTTSALLYMYYDKDLYTAGIAFQNALELERDFVSVLKEYCWYLLTLRYDKEALLAIDKALEYDPLSLDLICTKADLYRYQEDYQRALNYYQKAYQADVNYDRSLEGITSCYAFLNHKEAAYESLQLLELKESNPFWIHRLKGEVACHFDDLETYHQSVDFLEQYAKDHPELDLSGDFMSIYSKRDPNKAMHYLKKAYANGIGLVSILRYPTIKPLQQRADYKLLIQGLRLNLTSAELNQSQTKILHIKSELNHSLTIQKADFVYAKADGNYTKVYFQDKGKLKSELLRLKISALEAQLVEKGSMRVHNSYLVNMDQPNLSLKGNSQKARLYLKNFDVFVPVSRKKYSALK